MQSRRDFIIGLGFVALGVTSCGNRKQKTYPVSGKVYFANGQPAEHTTLVFHPLDQSGDPEAPRPHGKVKADGSFTLTTFQSDDGAPAGRYQITAELWLSSGKADEGPKNWLPSYYAKPDSSGIIVTVNAGPTTLDPIHLKA